MRMQVSGVCPSAPPTNHNSALRVHLLSPFGNDPFLPGELRGFWWFYIGSHRQPEVTGWLGPHDLDREIKDARRKAEKVQQLSTGLDGDWFLRTDKRLACKMDPKGSASNVEKFSRQLREAGFSLERHTIQFFTFVPDPTGYIAVVHDKDGSMSRCAWTNVPHRLSQLLESNANNGIRLVTVGKNGSYVVILDTGAMWWSGVPGPLSRLLEDARREGRVVTTVSLSLIADTWYFIAFADGGTRFALPPDWHDSINRHTDDAKETPSDNRASSLLRLVHNSPRLHKRSFTHHESPSAHSSLLIQKSSFTHHERPSAYSSLLIHKNPFTHHKCPLPHSSLLIHKNPLTHHNCPLSHSSLLIYKNPFTHHKCPLSRSSLLMHQNPFSTHKRSLTHSSLLIYTNPFTHHKCPLSHSCLLMHKNPFTHDSPPIPLLCQAAPRQNSHGGDRRPWRTSWLSSNWSVKWLNWSVRWLSL
ncbi:hypothetical protein BC826DRAFT_609461 [Russula brevipes]|nr:hypothetical protein BC826DRAFT_609461 [Russula brevipes]